MNPVILGLFLLQKGSNKKKNVYWSLVVIKSYKKSKRNSLNNGYKKHSKSHLGLSLV